MKVIIIGGDNLESILSKLEKKGFSSIKHISGRKNSHKRASEFLGLRKVDLVIILVDYINHGIVKNMKERLKKSNTKTIFSKCSWIQLENQINNIL